MRDAIGNKILEGNLLHWVLPQNLRAVIVRAIRVHDGGLSIPGAGNQTTPPILTLQIDVPIDGTQQGREPQVGDFIRIVDPKSEMLLEQAGGKPS